MRPETAATIIPITTGPKNPGSMPDSMAAGASSTAEPRIEGIDIRNTYLTANSLLRLHIRLPNSVEPDLEIPGQIAIPCTMPMKNALRKFICLIPLFDEPIFSAKVNIKPVIINPIPIGNTDVYNESKKSSY